MTTTSYTIGVITPYLSDFIIGQLTTNLRAQAKKKNLNLIMIRANGYGHYELPLALDYFDGLLVVLNSASPHLIEQALAKGIPVVSTADDYAKYEVEQISSDQAQGIRDAFDHLVNLGHRHIGYAGELANIDIHTRYLAYQERLKHWHLPYTDSWTLDVGDLDMAGGREAGRLYAQGPKECTALLCATDMIAIGMMEQIKKSGIRVPEDLAIVGVDNTVLGSTQKPRLTSIDQNIPQLVRKAVERLIERIEGAPYQDCPFGIAQQLIVRDSCGAPFEQHNSDTFHSVRQSLLDDFTSSPTSQNESIMAMAQSGTDSILNLSSLYGPFLQWGCFARWEPNGNSGLRLKEFFSEISEDKLLSKENSISCSLESYPPKELFEHQFPTNFMVTLLPIEAEERSPWGVLAIVDDLSSEVSPIRHGLFNRYLDLLSLFLERDALVEAIQLREQKAKRLAQHLEAVANTSNDGIWDWDLTTNQVVWNNRLLEMLGFTNEAERQAHRNMNLFERMHPQDEGKIRGLITAHIHEEEDFRATFRLLSSENQYLWVEAGGKVLKSEQGHAIRFVGSMTDITEQLEHQQRIQHMAYHDPLTGLPNRAMLNDKLKHHIRNSTSHPVSVMLMDLDRFKYINDTYGHDMGDALLKHVAKTLQPVLRSRDFFARFGGDEFVFVCDLYKEEQALELAHRLLDAVETRFEHKGIEISSQGSIGIAFYPKDGKTADDLIKKADIAMYKAKRIESASAMLYNSSMNADVQLKATLEQQLKLAIEKDELEVHYQPQLSPISGRLLGVEALARWHSPVLGRVNPGLFIQTAESSGLIEALGQQISLKAMRQMARWHQQYPLMPLKLSLNVSPGQLMHPQFASDFLSWIEKSEVNAQSMTLEITETAAITDLDNTRATLQQLVNAGISISLDDFGTGYSSLSLLNQLPLNWIKIDRAFVKDIETNSSSQDIIHSIVQMCHSFGFQTVAEGVETQEQLKIIRDIGCDWVQGFVYSPALSPEEFEEGYLKNTLADFQAH